MIPSSPPPPIPGIAAGRKKGIPKWAWALTIGGVVFIVSLYTALYFGYRWVEDQAGGYFRAANPDFEFLYIATEGRMKVKHKATGREFLVDAGLVKPRVPIRTLANKDTPEKIPAWIALAEAEPAGPNTWRLPLDTGKASNLIQGRLTEQSFHSETVKPGEFTACSPKLLQCAHIRIEGTVPPSDSSVYSVRWTEVP
jgi:hypothetical protein